MTWLISMNVKQKENNNSKKGTKSRGIYEMMLQILKQMHVHLFSQTHACNDNQPTYVALVSMYTMRT